MTDLGAAQWLIFIAMVGNYSKALMRFLGVGTLFMIVVIYAACVLINFLACIWYFTATIEGQENSWLTSVGSDHVSMADQATPRQWIASVYWTTTTILTVGFGAWPLSKRQGISAAPARLAVWMYGPALLWGTGVAQTQRCGLQSLILGWSGFGWAQSV